MQSVEAVLYQVIKRDVAESEVISFIGIINSPQMTVVNQMLVITESM